MSKYIKPCWITEERWEVCIRKEPLYTITQALEQLKFVQNLANVIDPERLTIYWCPYLPHLHVGHIAKKEKEAYHGRSVLSEVQREISSGVWV